MTNLQAPGEAGIATTVTVDVNKAEILNPIGWFGSVIMVLKQLCDRQYDDLLDLPVGHAAYGATMIVNSKQLNPHSLDVLKVHQAIFGVRQTALTVFSQPLFYGTVATLKEGSADVGYVSIYTGGQMTPIPLFPTTPAPTGDTGTIRMIRGFTVEYKFEGSKINSKDVFTAIMNAMIASAQFPSLATCTRFEGVGDISGVGSTNLSVYPADRLMTCLIARSALVYLFIQVILRTNKWQEMSFSVMKNGQKVGGGALVKIDTRAVSFKA